MTTLLGGSASTRAMVHEPSYGVWFADVELDEGEAEFSGDQTLSLEGTDFVGTIVPGFAGIYQGLWRGRLVGGKNGMTTVLDAKHYIGTSVLGLLSDITNKTQELFDQANSDTDIINREVPVWQRNRGPAGEALAHILDEHGTTARMQRSGQWRIGAEDGDEIVTRPDQLMNRDFIMNAATFAVDTPDFKPGLVHELGTVSRVITELNPQGIRQQVWFA